MKARLDTLIGRVTMYNLIVGVLVAIAAVALIGSLAGQIFYSPLALLASIAVAVIATVISSWLFARLFRTAPHLPSAVITGLLIFFVFIPTAEPGGLALLALAAVVASASKFLIAIRGRHLLNPVAAAAVVMSVTTLNPSGWWVATPLLLPFVAIGAFLVLYRTRKLTLGVGFIVVATVLITGRMLMLGTPVLDALWLAVGSFPVVFLAGFMLSEPLTLPPRRWQQFVVAGVVSVLLSIPFQIGPVYSSPEIALVVGNIVAFVFGQRRGVRMRYLGSRALTPTSAAFDFEPTAPVRFVPGQYLELTLPHRKVDSRGTRRMFSIASGASAVTAPLSVGVKLSDPSSSFKTALVGLEPGASVRATWVGGDFLLPADTSVPLLLAAGGIGVTPFVSQLLGREGGSRPSDVVLVYSVSGPDELAFLPGLAATGIRVLVTAPTRPEGLPEHWEYLGPGRVTAELLRTAVGDVTSRRAYVSGPPGYVDHVSAELRKAGARRIRTDQFAGY
ncbi:FAD-dependent oxidoreductase [Herbiconiux sp. CPCC 203407]|uniref:FAD-dependent oxidoreductase n=1 Tax=Herbiconiux oxytropis TaxID=2970915 RepID=A0AA41XF22_9MICO|nr:FAD-dependent oxidoreductase [Herbiconiux oxytropis]MCS5722759.1 FAD-dependent oxidoreductase [Herbiconiux oxytropis]MCS5727029.1 FAD-dependent oxidoreductase [Herbiconiux oxytropis]